jgi:hypothetical protein
MKNERPLLPTVVVAALCLATALSVAAAAHLATSRLVNEDVFLKNYRKLFFEESMLSHKMDYVLGSSENNDVVFLGDSTCLMDLDPRRVKEVAGRSAYNLGTLGWLAPDGHLAVLKAYLQHHPKPKLLVYTIWPGELAADYSSNEPFKDRFVWAYSPELRAERGYARWPLEFRLREEFRTMIGLLAARRTRYFEQEVVPGATHEQLGERLAETRGYFAEPSPMPVTPYTADLSVAPLPSARFKELIRFADEQGLRTLVRFAPVPEGVSDAHKKELGDWFAELKTGPNVVVSKPLVLELPPSDFADPRHLNASGVRRFTDLVVQESRHE